MPIRLKVLRTTALGGVLFLLPLIVVGAIIGQAVPIVLKIADVIGRYVPGRNVGGISLVLLLSILLCVGLCFAAGIVARLSLGRRFSGFVEHNLLLVFPRYAIVRDQMAGNVGSGIVATTLKPALVTFDDHQILAFESDRNDERVTVYLPGAPDPWTGQVVFVSPARVTLVDVDFAQALTLCKRLGRDSKETTARLPPSRP